ncbi:MAG TPA: YbaK/EbsC family protein [Mycobacteriales bacterium]|nr:YbaK/EbsC family protein [Mycobacteriales bacterium]
MAQRVWGLDAVPVSEGRALLAAPVAAAAHDEWLVAPIDPELADTAAFCAAYDAPLEASANCVVVAGRRGDATTLAACVVLATTRADVNGVVRKLLDARKASFAPMDVATSESAMEFGGITPVGLPAGWPIYVDPRVLAVERAIIGSGLRRSKLLVPGAAIGALPGAQVVDGLANPVG